jgi:hypothetical protein
VSVRAGHRRALGRAPESQDSGVLAFQPEELSKILVRSPKQPTPSDFHRALGSLAADFADSPPLSDDASSREGIYGDHP